MVRSSEGQGLYLTLGDEVLFTRSRRVLSELKTNGDKWVAQLDKELAQQKLSSQRCEAKSMLQQGPNQMEKNRTQARKDPTHMK